MGGKRGEQLRKRDDLINWELHLHNFWSMEFRSIRNIWPATLNLLKFLTFKVLLSMSGSGIFKCSSILQTWEQFFFITVDLKSHFTLRCLGKLGLDVLSTFLLFQYKYSLKCWEATNDLSWSNSIVREGGKTLSTHCILSPIP